MTIDQIRDLIRAAEREKKLSILLDAFSDLCTKLDEIDEKLKRLENEIQHKKD